MSSEEDEGDDSEARENQRKAEERKENQIKAKKRKIIDKYLRGSEISQEDIESINIGTLRRNKYTFADGALDKVTTEIILGTEGWLLKYVRCVDERQHGSTHLYLVVIRGKPNVKILGDRRGYSIGNKRYGCILNALSSCVSKDTLANIVKPGCIEYK